MIGFARTDTSILAHWWWSVDRWALAAVAGLIAIGILLTLAASPSVAERIGLDAYHFVKRQMLFLAPAIGLVLALSMLEPRGVRRLGALLFLGSLVLMVATLLIGVEIKGARRWISLGGLSLQASELVKPGLAVVVAWMLAASRTAPGFPGVPIATGLFALTAVLLVLQPDMGMTALITAMFLAQIFVAGLPLVWALGFFGLALGGALAAYTLLPHFASRINRFLDPASGDTYQAMTGLEAFRNGGFFGLGPGEGRVKEILPDAHSDFIFAVAGEEFGLIACLLIVGLFAFVVLRSMARGLETQNLFILLALTGLLTQFGLQALIHMASTLNLIPTKGMTLPFMSYGGSSLLGIAITIGFALALTRRRVGLGAP